MSALMTSSEVRAHFDISERTLHKWQSTRSAFPSPSIPKSGRSPAQWNAAEILKYAQAQPAFICTPSFQCFSIVALEPIFRVDRRTIERWSAQLDFPAPRIVAQAGCKPVVGATLVGTHHYWHIIDLLNWLNRLDSQPYGFCELRYEQIMAAYKARFQTVRTHIPALGACVKFFIEMEGTVRELEGRASCPFVLDGEVEAGYSIPGTITIDFLFSNKARQVQIPLWRLVAREQ
jgi:hypothetical protein